MYQYYNPHPKGSKTAKDCVKRAVCKVTGMDYMSVQRMLNRIKNEIGAEHFSCKSVGEELGRRSGWGRIIFDKWGDYSMMDGKTFCKEHPHGKYIVKMPRHWVACVDGVLYDTWDCSDEGVCDAWVIEEAQ